MPTVVASGQNAFVSFTDAVGSGTISTATGRFDGWMPNADDVGTEDVALGTGLTYKFIYRTDYTASFSISAIPASSMGLALRLKRWLESGGQITVATQDLLGSTYTCVIAPKSKVKFAYDRTLLEYTMTMSVLNTAAGPMLCLYSGTLGTNFSITVTPSSVTLGGPVGSTTQLTATVRDPNGNVVANAPVVWSSTNNAIAQVSITGLVTAQSSGSVNIVASIGSTSDVVPCAVTILNIPAVVGLTPASSLAFNPGTTYVGSPQVGKSGVPSVVVTAQMLNGSNQVVPYVPGALTWSVTGGGLSIVDNNNGTATVTAIAGGKTGNVVAAVTNTLGTGTVVQGTTAYSTTQGQPAALVFSSPVVTLTAPGVNAPVTVQTVDAYGVLVP